MLTLNQIIIIEDNPGDFLLLKENLAEAGLHYNELIHVQSLKELEDLSASVNSDLIFLDLQLTDSTGVETFQQVNQLFSSAPIIILSGLSDLDVALQAIQQGAQDYLIKGDFETKFLLRSIQHSIQRKKKEEELKESENRLRTILNTDPDCIKLMTVDCELYDINKAGLQMIEAETYESVIGQSILSVVSPLHEKEAATMVKDAFKGESGQMQFEMITLKGNRRWCEINIVPYKNTDGIITHALGVTRDITQRKADEAELKKSSERFLMITSTTNDAVWEWDLITNALWANENHQRIYGLTINDPVPTIDQWIVRLHPEDRDSIVAKQQVALASQTNVFISEYRFRTSDNSYMNIFDRCYIVRNAEGEPVRMTGSLMDITERKKAEEIISHSNERFELIAKTTNEAIWESNLVTNVTWSNEMHQQLYGLKLTDPMPDINAWKERIHPDEKEQVLKSLQDVMNSKEHIWIAEYRFLNGDQEWINIYDRTYILRNGENQPVRMLGSMMDITNRKKAEEALQQSEEQYRTLVERATDGIFISDKSGKFYLVNSAGSRMCGYTVEELTNMTIYDLADPEELKASPFKFDEMMNENGAISQRKMRKKDGSITFVEINAKFLSDGRFLAFIRDITDRKKAEEELKTSYKSIRTLTSHLQNIREEERTHIAREIHDELGQQLTVLKMDISWMKKRIADKADELVIQRMNDILILLNETVNSVRRISSDLRPSLLDDLGLVAAVEWQMLEFEKRSGIKTSFVADEIGIDLSREITTGLFRIFQESLTNVVRYAEATKIKVSIKRNDDSIILNIQDNGVGFESEAVKKKKTLGILGMQERTLMMGGEYSIKSIVGEGTVVEVVIPIAKFSL